MNNVLRSAAVLLALYGLLARAPMQPAAAALAPAAPGEPVTIYFFWGDGCPHCAAAKPFLASLAQRHPNVVVRDFEVWYAPDNREILASLASKYGFQARAVPTIFIADRHWEGFSDGIAQEIEAAVRACVPSACTDAGSGIVPRAAPRASGQAGAAPQTSVASALGATPLIDLPIFGTVNLEAESLAASTALIALVDGFNPCSMWVMSMLLALTLHTGSRRKVFLVGSVYIAVTALVYGLFIAGLFSLFRVVALSGWLRAAVAVVALVFAAVNIKDYFWFRQGPSFTIPDRQKPGIFRRMRGVLDASQTTAGLVGATIVLAIGVSLVEFACTAGFPLMWTGLLGANHVQPAAFAALLGLYLLIYQLDELAVFALVVVSMKAARLQEPHARLLKLGGGVLMLALGTVMLVDPGLMNSLTASLVLFGAAAGVTLEIALTHRWLVARLGQAHRRVAPGSARPPRRNPRGTGPG